MRTTIRGLGFGGVVLALALFACSPPAQRNDESSSTPPSNEQREAAIAAQQLAALGGAADAATQANYTGDFQASGGLDADSDEGAWELSLLSDYAQFTRPGLGDDGGIPGDRQFHQHGMRVVAGPLTITIMEQPCQAGTTQQPYVAHVLFEGVAYDGCARRGAQQGERPTWASVLPDLIPAIDACVARVTTRPARITFAGAIDEGQTNVRLREGDGTRRECIVDGSGQVSAYDPISDLDRRGGEGDPEFQRGGNQPRAERCRTIAPATGHDGAPLGWLIRRSC
ncbi:MAG: hypothetical protein HY054_03245 [Proteobacteria bacterium]|nr:hypothetical protein [Pseudomonadota bacterium]